MSFSGVPGATGQPTEALQGPSMETLKWIGADPTPKVDYATGNPLQDTSPAEMKPQTTNDSQTGPMTPTANDINGGKTLQDGGGIG